MLTLLVAPLLLLLVAGSFYRFVVLKDYLVSYQIDCDPTETTCHVGCEDDACAETYYYAMIEKKARELHEICGDNITDCEDAFECSSSENYCEISYCDPTSDTCAENLIEQEI